MVTRLISVPCGAIVDGDGGLWKPLSDFQCYAAAKDGHKAFFC